MKGMLITNANFWSDILNVIEDKGATAKKESPYMNGNNVFDGDLFEKSRT